MDWYLSELDKGNWTPWNVAVCQYWGYATFSPLRYRMFVLSCGYECSLRCKWMLKHTFWVSWWIGICLSQKKVAKYYEMQLFAHSQGTHMQFAPVVSVPIACSKSWSWMQRWNGIIDFGLVGGLVSVWANWKP